MGKKLNVKEKNGEGFDIPNIFISSNQFSALSSVPDIPSSSCSGKEDSQDTIIGREESMIEENENLAQESNVDIEIPETSQEVADEPILVEDSQGALPSNTQ